MTLFGAQTHVRTFDAQVQSGSQHFHWGPLVNLWTPKLKTKTEMQEGELLSVCTSIAFSLRACLVLSVIESFSCFSCLNRAVYPTWMSRFLTALLESAWLLIPSRYWAPTWHMIAGSQLSPLGTTTGLGNLVLTGPLKRAVAGKNTRSTMGSSWQGTDPYLPSTE